MKLWYAIQYDENDNDWGTGSYNLDEAKDMAIAFGCSRIAVVDETNDGQCVDVIEMEMDDSDDVKIGDRFYDEHNGRYLTVDSVGCDPNCFLCVVEEMDNAGEFQVTDTALFMRNELKKMKEVN